MYLKSSFARLSVVSGCRISRLFGPQIPRQAKREVTSSTATEPSSGRMRPDPGQVVLAERRPGDDPEAILGEPRHGEVALDPATLVQHLRVRDRAHVAGDLVVAEVLEEVSRARAGDLDLGERRLVEQSGRLARRPVLGADRRRPEPARPAAGRNDSSPAAAFGSNQFGRSQPDFSPKDAPSSLRRG